MSKPRWRALLALAGAGLALRGARAAEPEPPAERTAEVGAPGWSVTFETAAGFGDERVGPRPPGGIAAGFALLFRWPAAVVGPFAEGAASGVRDSAYLGLAAGVFAEPARWARLELLCEAGLHHLAVESDYAGQPRVSAELPFVGLRASATAFDDLLPMPQLLWARRAGIGLRLGLRADLGRQSIHPAVAAGAPPAAAIRAGGFASFIEVLVPLEW